MHAPNILVFISWDIIDSSQLIQGNGQEAIDSKSSINEYSLPSNVRRCRHAEECNQA